MSLIHGTSITIFAINFFSFQHGLLLWSTSHKSVSLEIMLVKTCLVTGLLWQFLFFPKIMICGFIVIGSSTNFCHGNTIVLLFRNPAFYQIYQHFRITVEVFLYLIHFVWKITFKSICIFHATALLTRRSFSTAWLVSTYLIKICISGRAALTKSDFEFLLFLKSIIGTLGIILLWSSPQTRITCNPFNGFFRCLNTG